jgi:hypothetical protein
MLIKFLSHGEGSGQSAMAYLLGPRDHRGTVREEIQVLRGNPEADAKLIDNLTFKKRYSSGVLAWAPEDQPTDEQIQAVLDDFEKVAFAGLQGNQYTWSAVLHREKGGGVHVHLVVPRVELQSGKSFNVAPPRWDKDLNPVAEMHNYRHGWARPDDPGRRRVVKPGPSFEAKLVATAERMNKPIITTREQINDWIVECIGQGLIENRADIRASLAELGKITRENEKSISVKLPGAKRAIRLKGAIYEEGFYPGCIEEIATEKAREPAPTTDNVRRAERKFQAACERRRKRNLAAYPARIEQSQEANPEVKVPEFVHSAGGSRPDTGVPGRDLRGQDSSAAVQRDAIVVPRDESSRENTPGRPGQSMDADEPRMEPDPRQEWPVLDPYQLKGEDNGSTNRDRASITDPDWDNSEELGAGGSSFDEACRRRYQRRKRKRRAFDKKDGDFEWKSTNLVQQSEELEHQSKQLDNTAPILARVARAIKSIGATLEKWVTTLRREKEQAELAMKPTKKERPKSDWEMAISLDLKPPGW